MMDGRIERNRCKAINLKLAASHHSLVLMGHPAKAWPSWAYFSLVRFFLLLQKGGWPIAMRDGEADSLIFIALLRFRQTLPSIISRPGPLN